MRFIDSSIFLCEMLKKPLENYEGCRRLITEVMNGRERVATTIMTFAEIIWVLELRENFTKQIILEKVVAIDSLKGLEKLGIGDSEIPVAAMAVSSRFDVDYVDAINLLAMQRNEITEIYSLDQHYDFLTKVFGIKRLVP